MIRWGLTEQQSGKSPTCTEVMQDHTVLSLANDYGSETGGLQTSTCTASLSGNPLMWPSGNNPLGNRDNRTNSGKVSSSSRERTNLVPLFPFVSRFAAFFLKLMATYRRSMVIVSSAPTSRILLANLLYSLLSPIALFFLFSFLAYRDIGLTKKLTSDSIDGWSTLLYLSNDTRGSSCGRHYV